MELKKTGPVGALIKTFAILRANPSLFLILLLWAIFNNASNNFLMYLGWLGTALQSLWFLIFLLVYPFIIGGIFSIIIKAQEKKEENWFSVFKEGGKDNFLPLLLGSIFYMAITFIFFMAGCLLVMLVTLAGVLISIFAGKLVNEILGVILLIPSVLIPIPLFLGLLAAFHLFLQFYDIGIVAKNYDVIKSFKQSYRFTRSRFNSVFGFSLLKYGIAVIIYIPVFVFFIKSMPSYMDQFFSIYMEYMEQVSNPAFSESPDLFLPETLLAPSITETILFIITGTLYTAFSFTYHSTFFVQTETEVKEHESSRRLLLKIYGIGFASLILLAIITALMGILFYPYIEQFVSMQPGLIET